mgnify:CR=1 FL=1
MWPKISLNYSPNFNTIKRSKKDIKFIIIHYTGMNREQLAINRLCDFKSNVSAHFFIKKNGLVLNLVPPLYEAWHAGKSSWKNFQSLNRYSIGVEIQNSGHDNRYENFSKKQIISIKKLLTYLIKKYNVKQKNILGHSDIAPDRKKDPGEKFPWQKLANKNLCKWYNLSNLALIKKRNLKVNFYEKKIFIENLHKMGYPKMSKIGKKNYNVYLIKAFQRKFRQNLINGKIDQECFVISKNLLKT